MMRCDCFKYTSKALGGESNAALLSGLATYTTINAKAIGARVLNPLAGARRGSSDAGRVAGCNQSAATVQKLLLIKSYDFCGRLTASAAQFAENCFVPSEWHKGKEQFKFMHHWHVCIQSEWAPS